MQPVTRISCPCSASISPGVEGHSTVKWSCILQGLEFIWGVILKSRYIDGRFQLQVSITNSNFYKDCDFSKCQSLFQTLLSDCLWRCEDQLRILYANCSGWLIDRFVDLVMKDWLIDGFVDLVTDWLICLIDEEREDKQNLQLSVTSSFFSILCSICPSVRMCLCVSFLQSLPSSLSVYICLCGVSVCFNTYLSQRLCLWFLVTFRGSVPS